MTIKQHVMRIMELALLIDPPEVEDVGRGRAAVFVNWMPHCSCLSIHVYRDGWDCGADPTTDYSIYTDHENADRELAEVEIYLEILAREAGLL